MMNLQEHINGVLATKTSARSLVDQAIALIKLCWGEMLEAKGQFHEAERAISSVDKDIDILKAAGDISVSIQSLLAGEGKLPRMPPLLSDGALGDRVDNFIHSAIEKYLEENPSAIPDLLEEATFEMKDQLELEEDDDPNGSMVSWYLDRVIVRSEIKNKLVKCLR